MRGEGADIAFILFINKRKCLPICGFIVRVDYKGIVKKLSISKQSRQCLLVYSHQGRHRKGVQTVQESE